MYSFLLPLSGPCNFDHLLTRVSQSSHGAFYRVRESRLGRILQLSGRPYFVEVTPTKDAAHWQVLIADGHLGLADQASEQLQHLFALDADLAAFYQHAVGDPVTAGLVQRLHGARMIRDVGLFSSVINSIISQQLNLAFAAELKKRLWARCGTAVAVDDEVFFSDPDPEAVACLDYDELRTMQYSQRKAEYVIDFSRAVVDGRFSLERLSVLDDEEAIDYLSSLRGLGRWTAECVLLFGLGRPDLLPAKDVGLQRAVARFWQLPTRPDEAMLRNWAKVWSPWSSWYTYYLWLGLTLEQSGK